LPLLDETARGSTPRQIWERKISSIVNLESCKPLLPKVEAEPSPQPDEDCGLRPMSGANCYPRRGAGGGRENGRTFFCLGLGFAFAFARKPGWRELIPQPSSSTFSPKHPPLHPSFHLSTQTLQDAIAKLAQGSAGESSSYHGGVALQSRDKLLIAPFLQTLLRGARPSTRCVAGSSMTTRCELIIQ